MSQNSLKLHIRYIIPMSLYIIVSVLILVFASINHNYSAIFLGLVLLTISLVRIAKFISIQEYKIKTQFIPFTFKIIGSIIALLFLICNFDLLLICYIWAIYEIVSETFEGTKAALELIKEKNIIPFLEIILSVSEIVFAILLLIHKSEGLFVHLTFAGIACLIEAVIVTIPLLKSEK